MNIYLVKKCAGMLILIVVSFYSAIETAYSQRGTTENNVSSKTITFPRSRIVFRGKNSDLKAALDCLSRAAVENRLEDPQLKKRGNNSGRLTNNLQKSCL